MSLSLKSTVSRRQPVLEPIDADERAAQLQYLDQYCLLLEGPDGIHSLVFKHAITTIAPAC